MLCGSILCFYCKIKYGQSVDVHVNSCPICRHEDLKQMLDGNKEGQKLDAMKLIIGVSFFLLF